MPRVEYPEPFHIMQAIRRAGLSVEGAKGFYPMHRFYDRTTGNFKSVGWVVEVHRHEGEPVILGVLDSYFPETYQSTLPTR